MSLYWILRLFIGQCGFAVKDCLPLPHLTTKHESSRARSPTLSARDLASGVGFLWRGAKTRLRMISSSCIIEFAVSAISHSGPQFAFQVSSKDAAAVQSICATGPAAISTCV